MREVRRRQLRHTLPGSDGAQLRWGELDLMGMVCRPRNIEEESASLLGLKPTTLHARMKKLGIRRNL
jgi:hypothetical protein